MSNSFFQFKQFSIYQDLCSMKVCTDACIFGAHVAAKLQQRQGIENVLDIGAGTGLLSIMLAQKTKAMIDALEIDHPAAEQSTENFKRSPWKERLHVYNEDAVYYKNGQRYDCIVSNPPFYESDLHSPDERKNKAKHDSTLTFEQLFEVIGQQLAPSGICALLIPYHRTGAIIHIATSKGFHLQEKLLLQHTATHPWFRSILYFTLEPVTIQEQTLTIKDAAGNYTREFVALLKDYYLHL